jgi:citrate lyase subunit beta/citryl-CoA lyase
MKPLRTALFVPGNRPERIDKAVGLDADAVIVDLEDAVPWSQKVETRAVVRQKVAEHRDCRMFVRVNSVDSGLFHDDIKAVVTEGLDSIIVPKVDSPKQLVEINSTLNQIEKKEALAQYIGLIALIESAAGVQRIFEILSTDLVSSRFLTVAFGAADYALDLGIERTSSGLELDYPLARIAVACRAAGFAAPIDSPYMLDLQNLGALKAEALKAKQLGYQGKLVIHPNQIEICNKVFSPSSDEIYQAERVVKAFEEAEAKGFAAIQLDGVFIDYPIVKRSRQILKIAEMIKKN